MKIELIDESDAIHLEKTYPLSDAEARRLTPYQFTIKNMCTTSVVYDVSLEILENENRLASEYIAIEIDGEEKQILNTLSETEVTLENAVEGRYLVHGELGSLGSKSYSLKLWIDEHVTIEDDAMNKNFTSKIVVEASLNQIVYDYFNDYIIEQMEEDSSIEKFEHEATSQTIALTDYRYTGANPNNYVCFGSEESVCPEDNLYRIIGVMPTQSEVEGEYENRVKLIKSTPYVETESGYLKSTTYTKSKFGYNWSAIVNNNKWEESTLNIIVLNGVYWDNLGDFQKYISPTLWYLGAPQFYSANYPNLNPEHYYVNERSNKLVFSEGVINYVNYIGLMYPSDYAYSIGSSYRNSSINSNKNNYIALAWLYTLENKYYEWLLNGEGSGLRSGMIDASGIVNGLMNAAYAYIVRPTFYLKSNVFYKSGIGTQENPYRIGI